MRRPVATPLAAALVAAAVLAGCGGDDDLEVRTAEVARATVEEVVEAPGTVAARASATVTSPAAGRVAELRVEDGQVVEAGAVVLRIDSPQALAALRQAADADAQAASAGRVELPDADVDDQRARSDAAAQQAYDAARASAAAVPDAALRAQTLAAVDAAQAQYVAARGQAEEAVARFNAGLGSLADALSSLGEAQRVQTRAAVQVAQRTVDALVVRAPIGGVVGLGDGAGGQGGEDLSGAIDALPESLRGAAGSALGGGAAGGADGAAVEGAVAVGSPVTSGQQLLTITDVSSLSLTAAVDETDVLLVEPGLPAQAELDAVPGATYAAEVRSVDVAPTTSARGGVSYVVRLGLGAGADVDGAPAPTPRPGMSAVVDLRVRTAEDVVAVPAAAVFRDGTDDAVWLVRGGVVDRRAVRVGAQGAEQVEVTDGLAVGDVVVVSGADRVVSGQELDPEALP